MAMKWVWRFRNTVCSHLAAVIFRHGEDSPLESWERVAWLNWAWERNWSIHWGIARPKMSRPCWGVRSRKAGSKTLSRISGDSPPS